MSKALIQLVAYRRATTTSSIYDLKPFYLDITGSPNISVNYNFEDIKNPEKRKTDFSQKFKLPFTNTNNRFFEHWYSVNVEKLVYSQNDAIECKVIVNGNEVLSGNLKLMAVYQKAGYYECVVLGKISNLFSAIGGKSLKNAFETENSTSGNLIPDTDLDHYFTTGNIENSWDGTLQNTAGTSLLDSTGGVSKIVYPIRIRGTESFVYDNAGTYDQWLSNIYPATGDNFDYSIDSRNHLERQTPAIQLRTALEKVFSKAGFTWTSTFLDSEYFRRLYMTTGDHDTGGSIKVTPATATIGTSFKMINNDACRNDPTQCPTAWALTSEFEWPAVPCLTGYAGWSQYAQARGGSVANPANDRNCPFELAKSGPAVDNNFFTGPVETYQYYFTPPTTLEYTAQFRAHLDTSASFACASGYIVGAWFSFQWFDDNAGTTGEIMDNQAQYYILLDGSETYVDVSVTQLLQAGGRYTTGYHLDIVYGLNYNPNSYVEIGLTTKMIDTDGTLQNYIINVTPVGSSSGNVMTPYGGVVNVPENIDPDLKQKDFLKDVIQRFNLVVVPDAEDSSNLIVEPFKDYVGTGETRYWTDKIDTSKEIVIKPTTALQKQAIRLSDKPSEDFYNKYVSEFLKLQNVWGHYNEEYNNTFASEGEMTNTPMFAPYIIDRPHKVGNVGFEADMSNCGLQNLNSYNSETSESENAKCPPFLFYYCGTPVSFGISPSYPQEQITLNFIHQTGIEEDNAPVWWWTGFDKYPLCSAYEMSNTGFVNATAGATRTLLWDNKYNDWIRNLDQWNLDGAIEGTLYNLYWKDYIKELYSEDSRLLEVFLNLTSTDIYKFSFKDVVFIKNNYYRVLKIQNYQVGGNTSTKALLLKVPNLSGTPCLDAGCETSNFLNNGSPTQWGMYMWNDPAGGFTWITTQACCDCVDGEFVVADPSTGLGVCQDPDYFEDSTTAFVEGPQAMGMPPIPSSNGPMSKMTGSSIKTVDLHSSKFVDAKTSKFKSQYRTGFALTKDGVSFEKPKSTFARRTLKFQKTEFNMMGQTLGTVAREIRLENRENNIYIHPNTLTDVVVRVRGYVSDGGVDMSKAFAYTGTTAFRYINGAIEEVGGTSGGAWTQVYTDLTGAIGHPTFLVRITQDTIQQLYRFRLTAVCSGADPLTVIDYSADVELTTTELSGVISQKLLYAEYESGEWIEFENSGTKTYLEWN
tara:strand:+ start:4409 stop:8005 length:3597 start_codon:yes stop_codon:yes gene_type:complete